MAELLFNGSVWWFAVLNRLCAKLAVTLNEFSNMLTSYLISASVGLRLILSREV